MDSRVKKIINKSGVALFPPKNKKNANQTVFFFSFLHVFHHFGPIFDNFDHF